MKVKPAFRVQRPTGIETLHQQRPKKKGEEQNCRSGLTAADTLLSSSRQTYQISRQHRSKRKREEEGDPVFAARLFPPSELSASSTRVVAAIVVNTFSEEEDSERVGERGCE